MKNYHLWNRRRPQNSHRAEPIHEPTKNVADGDDGCADEVTEHLGVVDIVVAVADGDGDARLYRSMGGAAVAVADLPVIIVIHCCAVA